MAVRAGNLEDAKPLHEAVEEAGHELALIYAAIARTASRVSRQLPFNVGMASGVNPSGDQQAKLDIVTNDVFAHALLSTGVVREVASEEMEAPLAAKEGGEQGLSVAMDPLDGSSNIPTNNPLGSIFGIWKGKLPQNGRGLVGSAFVTYGPTLTFTSTVKDRVDQFVEIQEGPHQGTFVLAARGLRLPDKPEVYGFGAERRDWTERVERFVHSLETRGMRLRYGGTFIGDYNQILKRGGMFAYPETKKKPGGKLRLLYETAPVSYLTEKAGGSSTDGHQSILDVVPKELAGTSPFYVGSKPLIRELEGLFATSPA